ncbi:thioesterase [Phycicoccus sp. CSK15P-2]|uniref:thioesterase family protein n=1 Tax=Phycicoccus sp. CSK15P-2 TaxID=2807627 RepID=UPI001950B5FB|nr:hotdog domain-containing protein [Phycicoccus sp. CSK15P-2]MBM6402734.1 thioesterase [Phycicoccus sp. CSK15P-2]
MDVDAGKAEVERRVGPEDTAEVLGSGSLPVLGTPRLVAWAEAATVAALAPGLSEGETSVGVRVEVDHRAPSVVGDLVLVRAEVVAVEGRRVTLDVVAGTPDGTVLARGTVERVVVEAAKFLGRLRS